MPRHSPAVGNVFQTILALTLLNPDSIIILKQSYCNLVTTLHDTNKTKAP